MNKDQQPPAYSEVFPTAPPADFQQPMYPNVPQYPPPQQYQPQQSFQPLMSPQQSIQIQPPRPNVIVINQQVIFGENPIAMTCPSCQQQTVTKIEHQSNVINHSVALALCLFGLCCCVCVPYCIDSIKDVSHKCNKCGAYLGTYRRGRV